MDAEQIIVHIKTKAHEAMFADGHFTFMNFATGSFHAAFFHGAVGRAEIHDGGVATAGHAFHLHQCAGSAKHFLFR